LLQLQPGVQSQLGNPLIYGSDKAGAVSVNGGRGRSNNFSVNGGDANDQFVNLPTVQPSPDTIQEFRVLTNTFDAEYGRNSGSVVNVVTKTGTNGLHGDVYEFFRNKVLNARNYFEETRPQFQQNQFGGTLGGPIKKDRTFFFGSYEGRRVRQPTTFPVSTPPSQAERNGDFSANGGFTGSISDPFFASVLTGRPGCSQAIAKAGGMAPAAGLSYTDVFPNSQVPIACMDPVAANLMQQYVPLPNRPDGTYQATVIGPARADQMTTRVDHRINDRQNFAAYYYFNDDRTVQPFAFFQFAGATVPNFGSVVAERVQQVNLSHTWTVNSTSVNEFRFTYMREGQGTFQHPQKTNLVTSSCNGAAAAVCFTGTSDSSAVVSQFGTSPKLGITPSLGPNHEGVPFVNIAGGVNFGNNSEGDIPQIGNSFQWSDSFTKVAGKHTLKFGTDVRRQRFDQELFFEVSGGFTYTGGGPNDTNPDRSTTGADLYGNYFLGLPDTFGQGSAQFEHVRSTGLYLFAQDSWKIKPNLTLNYGLRWELDTPLVDIGQRVQTFRPGQQDTIFPCVLGPNASSAIGSPGTSCDPGGPAASVYPLGLVVPGDKGVPPGLTQTYYNSFAPRIGIAWSPGKSGKTSIRAGWGMFYNPIEQLVLEQFSAEPPFGGSSFFSGTLFNTPYVPQAGGSPTPNPFNGVLNPTRGQPVDWSVFRPILLFGQFPPNMRTQYSVQYNFGIQRELRNDLVLQVNYVGSQGHRLLAIHDINYGNPQTCLDIATILGPTNGCAPFFEDVTYNIPQGAIPAGMTFHLPNGQTVAGGPNSRALTIAGTRRYSSPECNYFNPATCPADGVPVFSEIYAEDPIANSNYNSLQASLEKRFAKGLQFTAAYTFSKSIDQASSFENILDPVNFRRSRSLSLFDSRQRFVLSYFWEFPVPKYSGAKGKILNGWAMSGITTFQSGFPIRITSASDNELFGDTFSFEFPSEPDQVLPFHHIDPRKNGGFYFNPNIFVDPTTPGVLGNAPRTICCGPGIQDWTLAFHKNTPITEGTHLEFRAEFFNAFNHTQFLNPCGNTFNCNDGSTYGKVSQARNPRLIQLALKYLF
jgi:hypothetical protein